VLVDKKKYKIEKVVTNKSITEIYSTQKWNANLYYNRKYRFFYHKLTTREKKYQQRTTTLKYMHTLVCSFWSHSILNYLNVLLMSMSRQFHSVLIQSTRAAEIDALSPSVCTTLCMVSRPQSVSFNLWYHETEYL